MSSPSQARLVLVTGGSGFLAQHCITQLLQAGYSVRTTVRTAAREADVRSALRNVSRDGSASLPLSFSVADLCADAGWAEAVAGCSFVLHVASPFPARQPVDENELITPSRDGTLRLLKAARDAKVERVVFTSSFGAIGYGRTSPAPEPYTEKQWTEEDAPGLTPYIRSKVLAERAAWDFIAREGRGLQLAVINPVGIFGPVLSLSDLSSSVVIINKMLLGQLPGCPRISFNVVDVRDVADLHIRAMTHPAAAGQRFLAVAGPCMSLHSIARLLRTNLGQEASRVPTRQLSDWLLWLLSFVSKDAAQLVPQLGVVRTASSARARSMLGWQPRSSEEAVLATARSLLQLHTDKSATK